MFHWERLAVTYLSRFSARLGSESAAKAKKSLLALAVATLQVSRLGCRTNKDNVLGPLQDTAI
jgi:hypothetical protein